MSSKISKTTSKEIRNNIMSFYRPVSMPGGWSFDHVETLKYNNLYYYGQYATGNKDAHGYYKFFRNITKPACDVATKFIDLDTSNFLLVPEGGSDTNAMYTWLMQRDLRMYLKETGFGKLMNQISMEFPKGHVVLKKTKNGFKKVPIVSMRLDPSAPSLEKTWHAELHIMSMDEIEAEGWDTEELKARPDNMGYYDVYETYVKEGSKWRRIILGGLHDLSTNSGIHRTAESQINEGMTFLPPIVLQDDTVKRTPYRELRWEEVEGRWLGFGFPEYLKDNQISENETENLERKAIILKALQLFHTTDEGLKGQNVLTDAVNGDIIISDDTLSPIVKDNADLSAYNNSRGSNQDNIERKTFTSDITTGGNLPSRTPLGVANLQASLATSFFEFKQENYGLFLKDLVWEDILPDFKNKTAKERSQDFLRSDEDRKKMEDLILDLKEWEFRDNYLNKTGFKPTLEEVDRIRVKAQEEMSKKENISVKIPARAYNDLKNRMEVVITGESMDVSARSNVLQIAMQIAGTNPAAFQIEPSRTILLKFLALGGYTMNDLNIPEAQQQQGAVAPQGGSVATPQPMQASVANTSSVI